MLDGSGIAGVAKVPAAVIGPIWVKVRPNCDRKGPPVTPPCVPGVQFPNIEMLRKPGGPPRFSIVVLLKVTPQEAARMMILLSVFGFIGRLSFSFFSELMGRRNAGGLLGLRPASFCRLENLLCRSHG